MAVKELKFQAMSNELRTARLAMKMPTSQKDMAGMIGVSEPVYNKIEAGQTMVYLDRARLIAAILGKEPAKLFDPAHKDITWGSRI